MIEFSRKKLSNGLTVIAHHDNSTPMAAVNLLYKVGSKNETPERTGFAHLFEHLMFAGSLNAPEYDTPVQMAGGENNAFTNTDYTDYYVALPKENIEVALWLESDRMNNLNINTRSLEVQRKVVIEEFAQRYLNQPYGDIWLLLRPLCYKVHPYRWATIGMTPNHIKEATIEDVKTFYEQFYAPNNAILTIASALPNEEVFGLAEKWFADIAPSTKSLPGIPAEPKQIEQRILEVHRDVPVSLIFIVFKLGRRDHRDFMVCDVISDILSNGTSSRMHQKLTKHHRLFSSVNAYVTGELDSGLFVITGRVAEGVSVEKAESALWQELDELAVIESYELEKVKNKFEANNVFGEINVLNKAINLAFFEMVGDAQMINQEVTRYNSVTKEEIDEVRTRNFRKENSSVLRYIAKSK